MSNPQQEVSNKLRIMVKNLVKLPTLPTIVSSISDLMSNPNVSVEEINKVISKDASLSAKVLKLVNSPFYGFPRKITTISHAIIVLGFNTVRDLVLSVSVFDTFKGQSNSFDRQNFWRHSIGVGVTTRLLAKRIGFMKLEEVFLAGLLHDIGKIILDQYANQLFQKVVAKALEKDLLLFDVERAALGVSHTDVGRWLADSWNLPFDQAEVIEYHHNPKLAKNAIHIVRCVHAADVLCRAINVGSGGDNSIPLMEPETWDLLKLDAVSLPGILEQIDTEIESASAFINAAK